MDSDIDLVLLADDVRRYAVSDEWTRELGAGRIVRTMSWGAITERRLALPSGLEVEVEVGTSDRHASLRSVSAPRQVVADGMRVLHDPDGLLAALLREAERRLQSKRDLLSEVSALILAGGEGVPFGPRGAAQPVVEAALPDAGMSTT